jgi:uncharacterized membrane protein HdeD (DUF308 family)
MDELIIRPGDLRVSDSLVMRAGRWWTCLLLGVVTLVLGLVLLLSPTVAVGTLALLVGVAFVATGLGELAGSGRYRTAWTTLTGLAFVAAGAVAVIWPGITLWSLAVITAIGLLVGGGIRLMVALADRPDGWGWLAVAGALAVLAGVFALAWPAATVLVLGAILGISMVVYGIAEIAFALALRDIRRTVSP